MLIRLLQGQELAPRQVILAPKLMVRQSCGANARGPAARKGGDPVSD